MAGFGTITVRLDDESKDQLHSFTDALRQYDGQLMLQGIKVAALVSVLNRTQREQFDRFVESSCRVRKIDPKTGLPLEAGDTSGT